MPKSARTLNPTGFQWNSIPKRLLTIYICFCTRGVRPQYHCCPCCTYGYKTFCKFMDLHCQKCLNTAIITALSEGLIT